MSQDAVFSVPNMAVTIAEEEIPMTMQVAMVVGDSVVLAGDRRWRFEPRLVDGQGWPGGTYGQNRTKIRMSKDGKLAVSCAENMEFSGRLASALLEAIDGDPSEERIKEVADSVPYPYERKSQLLVVSVRSTPRLLKYACWKEPDGWVSSCQQWDDLAIAGDRVNAAIFWAEHYHKRVTTTEGAIYLAAHLVTCAGILNPTSINGLEIAVCGPSGIQFLPKNEISALEAQARQDDERIGEMIFGNRRSNSATVHGCDAIPASIAGVTRKLE